MARNAVAAALLVLLSLGLVPAVSACGDQTGSSTDERRLVVFAASSLTEAFEEAGTTFEAAHPGTRVRFNFGGSSALTTQITEGAPADVFASADTAQMALAVQRGDAGEPRTFATNSLVVVTPADGTQVRAFADLASPNLKLVLAAPDVPAGRYAREALTRASAPRAGIREGFAQEVLANVRSNEPNVRAVLTKVQLGEADAGIVYATDARAAAGDVTVVEIPAAYNPTAEYPIAVVTGTHDAALARTFLEFILSAEGQAILQRFGFTAA